MKTLAEAIAAAATLASQAGPYSVVHASYPGPNGEDVLTERVHNLTTTTATGYTNANDWLAKAMGQGPSMAFATITGNATATGATSLTNSGASFPTSGQGLAGSIVAASRNSSGTGSTVYGIVVSNTSTVLTIDQWYDPTSTTGAAGTTPNATGAYVILPGQNPAAWLAVTTDSASPTTADTTLASELTTSGMGRAVGTYAHTAAGSTYTLVHLWTATGTVTINKEAQFGAATTTAGGVMPFESAEPSPPTLVSGDTLQNTVTVTI
ncbi:MAG TPA: hypothetical protein VKQ07_05195 [Jatrophihabitantaceae bacterium]|nr:hypothetical protein [Jatrophihabitantaceae bacterium]